MKRRKWLLVAGVAAVLVLLAMLAVRLGEPPPLPPEPKPNGYDSLIAAGEAAVGNASDYPVLSPDALRQLVVSNTEALRLVRVALTQTCLAPTAFYATNISAMLPQISGAKRLASLLAADGRLAELEGRPADAALDYAGASRLGNELSRGGFLINRLVGIACSAIGCSQLAKLAPKLKCEEARPVIAALQRIDETRVTLDETRANERRFMRAQMGRGVNPITWALGWYQNWQSMRKAEERVNRVTAHERLLAVELALRCFASAKGRPPARLEDLAPDYLAKIPSDPFTGRPLVYRPQGTTNWLVYSLGPDRVDDGGLAAGKGSKKGDILFDSTW